MSARAPKLGGEHMRTLDSASTSSARSTSNLSAWPYAWLWRLASSFTLSLPTVSAGFQPLGSSSKALRSELLARLASLYLGDGPAALAASFRFLGRPRSMMLDDSEAPRRWPDLRAKSSGPVEPSQGLGEARRNSMRGAETGVGRVVKEEASVVAERGYVRSGVEALGVKCVRLMGDRSILAERDESIGGELSDLSFAADILDLSRGAGALEPGSGMTKGARCLGEPGRPAFSKSLETPSSLALGAGRARSAVSLGKLAERSWTGGLPGMVAAALLAAPGGGGDARQQGPT